MIKICPVSFLVITCSHLLLEQLEQFNQTLYKVCINIGI